MTTRLSAALVAAGFAVAAASPAIAATSTTAAKKPVHTMHHAMKKTSAKAPVSASSAADNSADQLNAQTLAGLQGGGKGALPNTGAAGGKSMGTNTSH